ncbi:citrate synthase/methylcitrate synthase [Neobacillus niacini]|uniref:citrate synthase/methylcitrate synthase n=1 Tax=Neobacillus niacini TaxID=86668 RepID=UPI00285ACEA0|nr:citrate synthase/methylcitrate synthase [Neobacillus niacini]MDR6998349.1 citrate synthase [Neobacillus niacini]
MFQKGLKNVVAAETAISLVDGEQGRLIYRGYNAKELALHYSFEEVAYLIWFGYLPGDQEKQIVSELLANNRYLPSYIYSLIQTLPLDMEIMSQVRTAISALGTKEFGWKPTIEQAIRLTAVIPVITAMIYRKVNGKEIVKPSKEMGHVENYLYMLTGERPSFAYTKALEAYMILTMEHGMNASTFTSRVVSSTESDIVSAVTGAIGAMKGPLHGGAPTGVIDMLNEIKDKETAETWIRQKLERKEYLMGFGHRVYKTRDPRAEALSEIVKQVGADDASLELASYVEQLAVQLLEEYKPGRKLNTNVEFYAAAVMKAIDMSPSLFTPTFTVSRMVGWTAHVIEQSLDNTIFRPEAKYIGKQSEKLELLGESRKAIEVASLT